MQNYLEIKWPDYEFTPIQNETLEKDVLEMHIHGMSYNRLIYSEKFSLRQTLHHQFLKKVEKEV